jgi:hypothetical protein
VLAGVCGLELNVTSRSACTAGAHVDLVRDSQQLCGGPEELGSDSSRGDPVTSPGDPHAGCPSIYINSVSEYIRHTNSRGPAELAPLRSRAGVLGM